jgi:20S proteasome alpha/beta subunit
MTHLGENTMTREQALQLAVLALDDAIENQGSIDGLHTELRKANRIIKALIKDLADGEG